MPRPGPAAAAQAIASVLSVSAPPRAAHELLAEIVLDQGWASSSAEAAEFAERWEASFIRVLRREYSAFQDLGRACRFEFNSSSEYMIQGVAYIETSDTPEIQEAKRSRARFDEYAASLTVLSPTDFEAMSRGVLTLFKVREAHLTPTTRDEGIDFYGRLWLEDLLPAVSLPNVYRRMSVWLIGQAKKYEATQVATPDIRELVGAIDLARAKAFGAATPAYDDLNVLLCDPVFYLFFTTGSISSDGWRLLQRSGVIGMDGPMIAAFLADNNVGVEGDRFEPQRLADWLAAHRT